MKLSLLRLLLGAGSTHQTLPLHPLLLSAQFLPFARIGQAHPISQNYF